MPVSTLSSDISYIRKGELKFHGRKILSRESSDVSSLCFADDSTFFFEPSVRSSKRFFQDAGKERRAKSSIAKEVKVFEDFSVRHLKMPASTLNTSLTRGLPRHFDADFSPSLIIQQHIAASVKVCFRSPKIN